MADGCLRILFAAVLDVVIAVAIAVQALAEAARPLIANGLRIVESAGAVTPTAMLDTGQVRLTASGREVVAIVVTLVTGCDLADPSDTGRLPVVDDTGSVASPAVREVRGELRLAPVARVVIAVTEAFRTGGGIDLGLDGCVGCVGRVLAGVAPIGGLPFRIAIERAGERAGGDDAEGCHAARDDSAAIQCSRH
jgi:hypothetical protein